MSCPHCWHFTCNKLIYCYNKQFCVVCFSFRGIRDDLTFLLEEDLSSINLCALHCELRNTEQLLRSLGLFAYQVGSLPECNDELSQYGPENFNSRISVKLKEGQETAVEKHNIKVASFSGKCNVYHKLRLQPLNGHKCHLDQKDIQTEKNNCI